MSGVVCKTILNGGVQALVKALETILVTPAIHQDKLPAEVRTALIQRLADLDLAVYTGDVSLLSDGGLAGIVSTLERYGLVTDEVWKVFRKPW